MDAPAETTDAVFARRLRAVQRYAAVAAVTLWLARLTTKTILARTGGEPAVPLDDAFIHFQYARSLAEGRFFAFMPGEGYTSGATSLLWPTVLAPFYLIGFRDTSIIWVAWAIGWVFLGLLAIETKRLAAGLVGELTAVGAGAAVLGFGGYTWFAASGMEVTPLAWSFAYAARLCCTWAERPEARERGLRKKLLVMATVAPLIRPEGMLASAVVFATLAAFAPPLLGPHERGRARLYALGALGGPALPPLINRALTGQFATTTTVVKWLPLNPYYGGRHLGASVKANVDIFFNTLLDGREWSAIFIPQGSLTVALCALASVVVVAIRTGRWWRALLVFGLALAMALPTTYLSFLWNRLRYLWPFAFAWCIALACLARAACDLAALVRPRFASAAPLVMGVLAGLLAHHLGWSMDDVATSSYAIDRQQVTLGRWAHDNLPASARIGVNDTGAIAYVSGRRTFDVVGLTTPEEARYWVAGAGSRFEHYERVYAKRPDALPTHFIVYPHWMNCDAVLGRELTRATVLDQTILGGPTMVAYEARYDLLGSGALPDNAPGRAPVDELDVADLESEAAHRYDAVGGGGSDADDIPYHHEGPRGEQVDGGRGRRAYDHFALSLPHGRPSRLVARWAAPEGARLAVRVRGEPVGEVDLMPSEWVEKSLPLPPLPSTLPAEVEVVSEGGRPFVAMHYWVYDADAP